MHITQVSITNFRLLKSVSVKLEQKTTVIVGRNNSGKTSFTELFRRLLSEKAPTFRFEDFSLSTHDGFWNAYELFLKKAEEPDIRAALPAITVRLLLSYTSEIASLGALAPFIIDLNEQCTTACILVSFGLRGGALNDLFGGIEIDSGAKTELQKAVFCRAMKDRVPRTYEAEVMAIDPNDETNRKRVEWSQLRSLVGGGAIHAQRGLDDETLKNRNVLGSILEHLFQNATNETASTEDKGVVKKLTDAVESIQKGIDDGFNVQLNDLFPAFSLFGYPGLKDPRLQTETTLDVKRLLSDHTKVHYAGINGIKLPEAYNGLGVRNLIFILLKLLELFKTYASAAGTPGLHVVSIEEPEVHLHPQMQEVFISKLNELPVVFEKHFKTAPWPVQFIVTTHSSHLANKASFDAMRYFLVNADTSGEHTRHTVVKDLREGLGGTLGAAREFLHKYMTLTRCDLLFADKAILIEGPTERLLLPKMIEKVDAGTREETHLSRQYLTIMEVGGAYAHIFFPLVDFLELPTLIITDLDTVDRKNKGIACKVSQATHTSNSCIKHWFQDPDVASIDLLKKSPEDKTLHKRRLAYEIPEADGDPCGRSFEDAFVLANGTMFSLQGATKDEKEESAWQIAHDVIKKTDSALRYAIEVTDWTTPKYIAEGLLWLRETGSLPAPAASATNPSECETT